MSVAATIKRLRTSAQQIRGFRADYIDDDDTTDTLFEIAAMLAIIERLVKVSGNKGIVRRQGHNRFARKPGGRNNFNYVEVGDFRVYFGVEFTGRSGAVHAPDVVVALVDSTDSTRVHPIIVVECKHYATGSVPRGLTNAFVGVLVDLDRPSLASKAVRDCLQGVRYGDRVEITSRSDLGEMVATLAEGGWSFLETTCTGVPAEHDLIGNRYGFRVTCAHALNRLV